MNSRITFLSISFFIMSCSVNIDFGGQYEGQKLVVFGLLNAKKDVEISVLHTVPVVGEINLDTTSITDAEVLLIEDGKVIDTLRYTVLSSKYISIVTPQPLSLYAIRVCASGYPCVESQPVQLPPDLTIENFDYVVDGVAPINEGTGTLLMKIASKNFASSQFAIATYLEYDEGTSMPSNLWDLDRDSELSSVCGFVYHEMIVYDKACVGQEDTIHVGLETEFYSEIEERNVTAELVNVTIKRINDSYFRYVFSDDNPIGIDRAFQEGSPIYSNINGGYGFLGTEATVEYSIMIDR